MVYTRSRSPYQYITGSSLTNMTEVVMAKEKLNVRDAIIGRPVVCNKHDLIVRPGKEYAEVIFFGDIHLGSPACDENRMARMIDYCVEKELYVFLMGDLIESSTRTSIGAGVYEQARTQYGTIQLQHEAMCEYIRPLADKGLVLGYIEGNHEMRVWNMTGISIGKAFCRELNVRFLSDCAGWNYWKVGTQGYTGYTIHGSSGSRLQHTKIKALTDLSHSFASDFIAMGHVHECISVLQKVQYFCRKDRVIKERKKYLFITGHYLIYEGYPKVKGMPLTSLGSPKVKFWKDRHDMHISY